MLNKKGICLYVTAFTLLTMLLWYEFDIVYANEPQNTIDNSSENYNNIIEKRNHTRFNNSNIKYPIELINTDDKINSIIDISRDGIAISHNNTIKEGSILPIKIKYKDLEINTQIKVISADEKRAGCKFIPEDKETLNELLYLSIALESDNGLLKTRLKDS